MLSVIIPTLNAAPQLGNCLAALVPAVVSGLLREVIVVDAGSTDDTPLIAEDMGARVITSRQGRGIQLSAGAELATSPWLLFLHADSWLGHEWMDPVERHMSETPELAGYFQLKYRSNAHQARWLARRANRRAKIFGLPYGDQGLLISQSLYNDLGGFAPIPLMEDVDIARRLGKKRLVPLNAIITTSAEKYERDGWRKRSYANALLLGRYLAGASPEKLAKVYR